MLPWAGIVSSKRLVEEFALQPGRFKETAACYAAREAAKEWQKVNGLRCPFWLRDGFEPTQQKRVPLRESRRVGSQG